MRKPTGNKLLIVDDDTDYRESLQIFLRIENYEVDEAASVQDALKCLNENRYDLILQDVRMKEKDNEKFDVSGGEVARKAAEFGTPCIMITAKPSSQVSRIFLNSTSAEPLAIDVVEKKDGPLALLSAVQTVLNKKQKVHFVQESGLVIDLDKSLVTLQGKPVKLPQKQYDLLACLKRKNGAVTSHAEIFKSVYNESLLDGEARTDPRLERLVVRVREKIKDDPASPRYLRTEKGRGYRLILDDEEISQDSTE